MTQPSPVLNARAISIRLHQLKKTVHRSMSERWDGSVPDVLIRRALNDAAQAAEATGFPLLVFPVLAEEAVERVRHVIVEEEPLSFPHGVTLALANCA